MDLRVRALVDHALKEAGGVPVVAIRALYDLRRHALAGGWSHRDLVQQAYNHLVGAVRGRFPM